MFSRPPRREKSALGTFPPVEPILALQGREGQPRISLDRAVERECRARIYSRPPGREKSALGTLSRPGGRERVPSADLLSTARPREIRAWHSLSTATPREIRGWPSLPCRANVAKNFQSPKSKKKKVPTKLPSFESSRREPHFYRIARIRSERDLILAFFYRKIDICK